MAARPLKLQVITPSVPLAVGLALALLALDVIGWRVVSGMFDRERLITRTGGWQTEEPCLSRTERPRNSRWR
jgi:hypothetical protein